MITKPPKNSVSQAIRDLREGLKISQQELAFRTKMAIRTIARWEGEQPPHGKALVRLAELAEANDLNHIAHVFRTAVEDEFSMDGVGADPELKQWIEGVSEIYRRRDSAAPLWDRLTSAVIDGVRHIAAIRQEKTPDTRLSELVTNLMKNARLPAEREMDRIAEDLASREELTFEAAYARAKETHSREWEACVQARANRESDRKYERQHGFLGAEDGPDPR